MAVHISALMEKNERNRSSLKADDRVSRVGLLHFVYHFKIICLLPFETC